MGRSETFCAFAGVFLTTVGEPLDGICRVAVKIFWKLYFAGGLDSISKIQRLFLRSKDQTLPGNPVALEICGHRDVISGDVLTPSLIVERKDGPSPKLLNEVLKGATHSLSSCSEWSTVEFRAAGHQLHGDNAILRLIPDGQVILFQKA
jgi:hypothetical protein